MNLFPNWAKNILFLLVYMLSGLVLIIIVDGLLSGTDLAPLNMAIENTVTYFRTPFLTNLMVGTTYAGSPFVLFAVACLISVLIAMRGDLYNALIFVVSMCVAAASVVLLKEIFQVSRPPTHTVELDSWSFPSGHATLSTAFFFALAHAYFGRLKTVLGRLFLVLGSIAGAVLVSFSRLYLGAHWTLDILAGIALGLIAVSFTVLAFSLFSGDKDWLPRRFKR